MVFAALIPFMSALGIVKNADIWFYVLSTVFAFPFLACASFLGVGFTVVIMRFFPAAKIRNLIFIIGMVFFTFVLVFVRLIQPEKFVSSEGFELLSQYLGYLDAPTAKFLPSWWYTSAVTGLISKDYGRIFLYAGLLFFAAVFLWFVIKFLAKKYYMEGLNEGQAFASSDIKKKSFVKRSPVLAIFHKDVKVFIRDSNQWSQVLILASIVLVYLFSMYKLSFETVKMHNTMSLVNCALVWFVATAASLRLAFPLISLEGESFWFLLTSPVSRLKLFIEKVIFGSAPVFTVSMILMFATNYMMGISMPVFILTIAATAAMSFLISCSAVSIGAILPKFNYSNIPQIESSLGGLVFMLFSFFMIIVNILIIMQPLRLFYLKRYNAAVFTQYGAALILIDLIFFVIILGAGYNALKRIEK
jgi:ABC-2 type transport system permease protein